MSPSDTPQLVRPWSWSLTARQFAVFSLVGVAAFLVDSGVLYALLPVLAYKFAVARVFSWLCAVSFTWALNYQLTFRYRARSLPLSWFKYLVANLLLSVALSAVAHEHPFVAVALGSLAGLFFNFVTSKAFVFRGH
jgi:putative flippase GtrA